MIEIDPTSLPAFASLASLYMRQGRLEEAKAEYLKIGGQQPSSVTAPTMIAILTEAQGKIVDAERAYERVLAQHSAAPVAANNLAWLYAEHEGNLDVALDLAQKAKQLMPRSADVDDTLGWVYYKKDLSMAAVPALEAAVRAEPANALFAYHLGMAYAKMGDRTKAREAFETALKRKPDYREASDALKAFGLR